MQKLFILFLFLFCVTNANADWQIKTDNNIYPTTAANWNFSPSPNVQLQQVQANNQSLPLEHLHLSIKDGKTGKPISLSAPQITNGKNTFTTKQISTHLRVTQQLQLFAPQNNAILWKAEFINSSDQEVWIETGLSGDISAASGLRFWDGYESQKVAKKPIERSTPDMAFPATMISSTSQNDALVIALHPDNDISWITTSLNPQTKKYFYGGRFVIPAKQKITLTYVLYTLQPHFGELDAIDGYYQRFPSSFTAKPNTDPRLTGFRGVNSSYVVRNVASPTNQKPDPRILEGLAKLFSGWDWGYNTYKFSGDWFGRPESWNLPLSQGDQASLEDFQKTRSSFDLHDIEQFHKDRIALYKNADLRANNNLAFYIVDFAQAELAQKNGWMKYSYGYYTPDVHSSGRIKHWVASYDDTWHIFPWATPFGDSFKRDLPDILKELNTSSFAIDLFADSSPYRGETTEYIPGWSYDEKGKFINTGLAQKRLVEFIHTLYQDNFAASAVVNLSPWEVDPALKLADRKREIVNYSTAFAPDAYIVEGDVSEQIDYDQPNRLFPKRYLFGKKYISSVGGAYHDKIGERIPWRTMSPNQIRSAYAKYLKKRVMAYYQGGLLPNYDDARGIELITNEIPRLLDIESRGFTAAPASVGNAKLQRRRYGDELGAAIVYSNPTNDAIESQETLQNTYFQQSPNRVLLPFEDSDKKVIFSVDEKTSNTNFSLNIPSMENQIVLLPISLQFQQPQAAQGETSVNLQSDQQLYSAKIQMEHSTKVLLHVQAPCDFMLEGILVNNEKIQTDKDGKTSVVLTAGENQLKVLFTSTRFLSSEQKLSDFNWKQFQIITIGEPSERKEAAAQMIADYATYYQKFTPAISHKSTFDVLSFDSPTVVITTSTNTRGIGVSSVNNNVLAVNGKTGFDVQQLAWDLCRLLDRHSPLMPAATFTDPSTKAMLDRIGIMINAEKSHVAKPITKKSLQAVPGQDEAPSGNNGDLSQLDFEKIEPLLRDGWKATASAISTRDKTVSLEAALDGKDGTRWTGGRGKAGDWFMVDMGKIQEFNHVRLKTPYPYKYAPQHYKAELSDDGIHWRAAVTGEGEKDTEIFWPTMQKARYIRITLTQDQDQFWSIDEILVYKRALAKSKSAAPALGTLPHLEIPFISVATNLEDEELGQSFTLDLEKLSEFDYVQLVLPVGYGKYPVRYKAEISGDDKNWHDAVTGTVAKGDVHIHWARMQKARFIRVTRLASQEKWAIDEIKIHTKPVTGGSDKDRISLPLSQEIMVIDGKLEEAVWQKAATIDALTPLKDHPVTQPTQVKIFHDATNFYIGVICHEANMDKLWEPARERDGAVWSGDDVEIYLAPGNHNGELKYPYYQFLFSPSGVQTDLSLNAEGQGDIKWNADWQVKTFKDNDYWSAEVRIPFKDLNGQNAAVWRANIGRMETPNGDTSTWAPMQRIFAQPSLFGVWELQTK